MDGAPLSDSQSTIALYTQSAAVRRCRYHLATSTVSPDALSPSAVNSGRTPVVVYIALGEDGRAVDNFF